MSEVKRYTVYESGRLLDADALVVCYEDHLALEAECERLRLKVAVFNEGKPYAALKAERDTLRAELAALKAPAVAGGEREAFQEAWSAGEFPDAFVEDHALCLSAFKAGAAWQRTRPAQTLAFRDWTEDTDHENGNYSCLCSTCKQEFTGHKRRVICKACSQQTHADGLVEALEQARPIVEAATVPVGDRDDECRSCGVSLWTARRLMDHGADCECSKAADILHRIDTLLADHRAGGAS